VGGRVGGVHWPLDDPRPVEAEPATPQITAYPFLVADKAGLETLYAVLPLPRRSVLYGHYAWAMASFLATATMSTALALLLAQAQAVPFGGRTLVTMLTLSWAIFAINVAIQFPLQLHLHLTITPIQIWLPLLWVAGVAAIMTSAAVAITADQRRVH
jgi:hypothetical protein